MQPIGPIRNPNEIHPYVVSWAVLVIFLLLLLLLSGCIDWVRILMFLFADHAPMEDGDVLLLNRPSVAYIYRKRGIAHAL